MGYKIICVKCKTKENGNTKTGKTFIVLDIIFEADCSYGEIYISFIGEHTINPAEMPLIRIDCVELWNYARKM